MGLLDVIQIVLIILKLANLIAWSWWIVLIPLWIIIILLIYLKCIDYYDK